MLAGFRARETMRLMPKVSIMVAALMRLMRL
jgi:hypothetical protein